MEHRRTVVCEKCHIRMAAETLKDKNGTPTHYCRPCAKVRKAARETPEVK